MRKILLATLLTAVMAPAAAQAETIDLATVKCSELANMPEDDATFLFTWLLGYQNGQTGTTTMDLTAMESTGTEIGDYCGKNPEVGILAASTEVMTE